LGNEAEDVHVFRVDITRDFADISGSDHYTLSEVPAGPPGWLLPRTKVSATYGIFVFGIALNYPVFISHSLAMRLYRPGYELVELDSWDLPEKITWKPASDLQSQERALDRLFLRDEKDALGPAQWPIISHCLSPGSKSRAHRRALLFGASGYERLATSDLGSGPERTEERSRLQRKALDLRELASKTESSPSLWRLFSGG
jgi:hypothetical protein